MTDVTTKIIQHKEAYENLGIPVPPFRITLAEWKREYHKLKRQFGFPENSEWIDAATYLGVELELVVKIF